MSQMRAFTLIELAIVLSIIALITGAVVTSRTLIETANRQAQVAQIGELNAATSRFIEQYYYAPGDCPNCVALGLQTNNGDGDGRVEWDFGSGETEIKDVLRALENAGLSNGSGQPLTGFQFDTGEHPVAELGAGNIILVEGRDNQNGWFGPYSGTTAGMLTGEEVSKLDLLIDDGLPYQGEMVVVYIDTPVDTTEPYSGYFGGSTTANTNCIVAGTYSPTSTTDYTRTSTTAECMFWIRANY